MEAPKILIQRDGGLFDLQGNPYNELGQRLDEEGNVVAEAINELEQRCDEEIRRARDRNVRVDRHGLAVDRHPAQNRTLADFNRPEHFYANRAAIRPPAFQRNDFELKPAYFSLVAQDPFCGLPHENPMDHIERFEDLASAIKANGVSEDYLFCKLFPYSLHGEAKYWLKTLPPGSLTNWMDTKNAFLSNFFDDARTEDLRSKIATFKQGDHEAFKVAWCRFKSYQRDCPHHGFNEVQLLGIFYRGIALQYSVSLDAASNGNFNTNSPWTATQLIENIANSTSAKSLDYERSLQKQDISGNQLAEVTKKLDSMHSLLTGKKTVQFAQEVQTFEPEDVNYVNSSGFQKFGNQQGYGSKPFQSNNGYQRNYGSSSYQKPLEQDNEMKNMLEQILEGQQQMTVSFNGKMDDMYRDLNGKFESLSAHVKKLDVQVAQSSCSSKRQDGFLPAKTDANPRNTCNAVLTEEEGYFDEFDANLGTAESSSIDTHHSCRSTREEKLDTKFPEAEVSIDEDGCRSTRPEYDDSEIPVASASIDTSITVDRHDAQTSQEAEISSLQVEESIYKPKLPFPRARKSKQEVEEAMCKRMIEKIIVEIPLVDAIKLSPAIKRYVKRMVANGISPEEGALLTKDIRAILLHTPPVPKKKKKDMVVSEEVSAMIQSRVPVKLPDPGSFVLNCSISTGQFPHSLCDLGSSINLMPLSVAIDLGMTNFRSTRMSLLLADRSRRFPEGILEDVPIRIRDCIIPTDFVVLEYDDEPQDPLILGRSFLATAGAHIDCRGGRIKLDLGDVVMEFDMDTTRRKPTIDGQAFSVDTSLEDEPIKEPSKDVHVQIIEEVAVPDTSHELPLEEPRYEPPILNTISSNFINVEKAVTRSCKLRVPRKLGLSDELAGKRKEKVKPQRTSRPFAKMRIIIPLVLKGQGEAVLQEMMEKTLKLFPETVSDKSGGATKNVRLKQVAACSIDKDKGSTVLPKDPP